MCGRIAYVLETSARLLPLLSLLQNRRDWTGPELARRLEVSTALDAPTVADFTVVGPVGFVLDKAQWIGRYRSGTFVTSALTHEDVHVRVYGDAAVSVGVHTQRAAFRGTPADGSFRATHVAVRENGEWRLAGMQLSPIGGPPPFAPRPAEGQAEQG